MRRIKETKIEAICNQEEGCLDDWKWDEGFASGLQEAYNILEKVLLCPPERMKKKAKECDINIETDLWDDIPRSESSE